MKMPSIAGAQNVVASISGGFFGSWTVLDHEEQTEVCSFDCFYAFGYNKQSNVVQYPIENGSFATYNKQNNPLKLDISLIKSGLNFPFQKRKFISKLQDYCENPWYVDVVTPSGTYLNCTLSGLSFENSAEEWADAIRANMTVTEVRHIMSLEVVAPKKLSSAQKVKRGLRSAVGI